MLARFVLLYEDTAALNKEGIRGHRLKHLLRELLYGFVTYLSRKIK